MSLPADVARCKGFGSEENGEWYWREGCQDCYRRTCPPIDHPQVAHMTPPPIIVFECEYRIEEPKQ